MLRPSCIYATERMAHGGMSKQSKRRHNRPMSVRLGAFELRKSGVTRYDFRDIYHQAIETSWSRFFLALFAVDIAINGVFAFLYLVRPDTIQNARPGSFS